MCASGGVLNNVALVVPVECRIDIGRNVTWVAGQCGSPKSGFIKYGKDFDLARQVSESGHMRRNAFLSWLGTAPATAAWLRHIAP
jgi:hypothetical protein